MAQINRRDILKLAGMLPFSLGAPHWTRSLSAGAPHNVMVLVFDALSAYNLSIYGYARQTTPNLARRASRAIVYHNHFAGSNFTSSGTASLLTGTLPWTNRAMDDDGTVAEALLSHNIFKVFDGYYRSAFSHNSWVVTLLRQFGSFIDEIVPREKLYLGSYDGLVHNLFSRDDDIATVGWTRYMKTEVGSSYSLFLSGLYKMLHDQEIADYQRMFPLGMPVNGSKDAFVLEQTVDWLKGHVHALPQPFLGYFHFLPPHAPYRPSAEFYGRFDRDRVKQAVKPRDVFADKSAPIDFPKDRAEYDEFILYADKAFGELFAAMEASSLLDHTWVIFTSDHGEMFERGLIGHGNATLYQPLVRVPLLIFEPGRETGVDIHTATSAADLLPTLAHLAGRPVPDWTEGIVLPPFQTSTTAEDRKVYSVTARKNGQAEPLHQATTMLVRGRYKLIYAFGYGSLKDSVKLFDIEADPEELVDLARSRKVIAAELLQELKSKLNEVNQPYL